jgi:hypothetical protein
MLLIDVISSLVCPIKSVCLQYAGSLCLLLYEEFSNALLDVGANLDFSVYEKNAD